MGESPPQLAVQDLVLASRETGRVLLDHVSATVRQNERVGLIGASGAGKTLLARSLIGLLPNGVIRTAGHLARPSDSDLPGQTGRPLASMVPQNPVNALPPSTTALRLVRDAASWTAAIGKRDGVQDVSSLLATVGLGKEIYRRRAHQLSGGMAMRVAIGAALARNPWFLVLDEPSSGLDPVTRKHVAELLLTIARDHATSLVVATHDLWMVDRLCDRVLVLENGRVVAEGNPRVLAQADPQGYVGRLLEPLQVAPNLTSGRPIHQGEEDPALELNEVTVDYVVTTPARRRFRALSHVSLKLPRGGSIGIIGRSGAGKSTLALAAAGLLAPTQGNIRVFGNRIPAKRWKAHRRQNHRIRMVFQNPFATLNPRRQIGNWLSYVLRSTRDQHSEHSAMSVEQLLDLVHLPESARHCTPAQLSGGECQRAVIAACLASRGKILILDEPVSMLDPIAREGIINLLSELRLDHKWTYLIVSHDLPTISRLCEHIIVLEAGRVVEEGSLECVLTEPQHDVTKELLSAYTASIADQRRGVERSGEPAKCHSEEPK